MTDVTRPVVLIAEELSPATVEALGPDFEIRHTNGADRAELIPAIADVDAILIRSATKVDEEALAAAKRLKVVARAGVGLDNVDVRAATQNGVLVVNAPTSNIVSAAELAVALMLAAARHLSPAHAALTRGEWKRSRYTGTELYEKTVVATPDLGAATDESQENAGIAVARSVRLALSGELVPAAVNVQGGLIAEDVRPGIPLVEKLGRIFTALAGEVAQQIDVEVRGEITEYDVKVLELAALKGVFADVVEEQVTYVNAPLLAAERGTAVRLITDPDSPDHRNLI